jgi:ubiquinone/menaquinone biosynthesis C-methylase UbiE
VPQVLWGGKLSPSMKIVANVSNILAWVTGNGRNTAAMKRRVKMGYDGAFTNHVLRYDELGLKMQMKAAKAQLEDLDLKGKEVLDVGAGTGALSFLALEMGAAKVVCGDISSNMLDQCRKKAADKGLKGESIDFRLLDAESLPFPDNSFDVTMTGMTLGLIPDQAKAISEMARVTRGGGTVAVGGHGPEHYWEAADTIFRSINKRYVLGYRLEFWPRTEKEIRNMMAISGLSDIRTGRMIWHNIFPTGGEAFDFFASISSSWWYARFPENKRQGDSLKVRNYFVKKNKNQVTDDVILAYGRKSQT